VAQAPGGNASNLRLEILLTNDTVSSQCKASEWKGYVPLLAAIETQGRPQGAGEAATSSVEASMVAKASREMNHFVYIIRCADGTLYTGATHDVKKRIARHNAGKGAKYTRGRGPVVLACVLEFVNWRRALEAEREIKTYPRQRKLWMCAHSGMKEECALIMRGQT